MAKDHERLFGDTAALCFPSRSYAILQLLSDPIIREKLIHGSDWPIISFPPAAQLGLRAAWRLMQDRNWIRRDVATKELLGFDDAYFRRASAILRLGSCWPAMRP
jgi:hypothetical protein